jgi:hypothetical protein
VNPRFHNATLVFVHYCDGASFSSNATAPLAAPDGSPVWMRGRPNLLAVLNWLWGNEGLSSASTLILSGGSAGATAAYLAADVVRAWLPQGIRMVVQPDAGFFLVCARAAGGIMMVCACVCVCVCVSVFACTHARSNDCCVG